MSAGPKATFWKAESHTIAKIAILEAYLVAYFQILGRTRPGQTLLYIDGFAGPNKYTNRVAGSPSAAISAATTAINNAGDSWRARKIHMVFVEQHDGRYEALLQHLPPVSSGIEVHTYNMAFTEALGLTKAAVPDPFRTDLPLFVFIDPFGATGAPFATVAEILNSPCSEVLINLDADGVARIFAAKHNANHEAVLTDIFGDTSWQSKLRDDQSFDTQCREVLHLYKERLRSIPDVRYIFEVEMQGSSGTLNYYLVFASKHPLGLIKMKEAMKSIDQNGAFKFADADVGQTTLFRFDDPEAYHMRLYETFKGMKIEYDSRNDDVTAYALNFTPFVDAKAMLRILEKDGMITALSNDPKRKTGAFNEKVTAIHFHGRIQDGFEF